MQQVKRGVEFLREVRLELKKVTWPTRPEVVGTTGVVMVIVFIFSIFLYLADLMYGWIIKQIFGI
ncbi:MAG: preprotein translocase subunit SecE [Acidobacteriota bacterium]|nr:MAG: preprotein translocase subunit SecE [Acidobacteriota bacterium]